MLPSPAHFRVFPDRKLCRWPIGKGGNLRTMLTLCNGHGRMAVPRPNAYNYHIHEYPGGEGHGHH